MQATLSIPSKKLDDDRTVAAIVVYRCNFDSFVPPPKTCVSKTRGALAAHGHQQKNELCWWWPDGTVLYTYKEAALGCRCVAVAYITYMQRETVTETGTLRTLQDS